MNAPTDAFGNLAAPFPYFGGKSRAAAQAWAAFGDVANYVEPFAGSAAMLLAAPEGARVETINDYDGMVANFWRAVSRDPDAVALYADWPTNETDLFARHLWLVERRESLTRELECAPDFYDAKVAGWWVWGACNWIGSGWCDGHGPWRRDGLDVVLGGAGQGINRQLPHLGGAGQGINRKLPHLSDGGRLGFIRDWMRALQDRMRDVRVACGDWRRVLTDSVTTRHGTTAVFLDPPYERGNMDYGAGGMKLGIARDVEQWCAERGADARLRIVLCGHAGEHDALIGRGWSVRKWRARKGYAVTTQAVENAASETLWCSPACEPETQAELRLFA